MTFFLLHFDNFLVMLFFIYIYYQILFVSKKYKNKNGCKTVQNDFFEKKNFFLKKKIFFEKKIEKNFKKNRKKFQKNRKKSKKNRKKIEKISKKSLF